MTGKIFRNAFIIGLVTLIVSCVLFMGIRYKNGRQETEQELERYAASLAEGIPFAADPSEYLRAQSTDRHLLLTDADGNVIYHNDNEVTDNYIEVRAAVPGGGEIAVACAAGRVTDLLTGVVTPMVWVFVLMLLLAAVLSFRMTKQLLKPVNDINPDNPDLKKTYRELAPLVEKLQEQNLTISEQMDELGRRQKEFSALTDSMSEGFLLIDRQGSVLSGNHSAFSLLGCAIGDLLFDTAGGEAVKAAKAAAEGTRVEKLLTKDSRTWQLIANPVNAGNRSSGAVLLLMDVTEREQREQLRQEFSANVSHELKTPLTSISGFAELMMEGMVEPEKQREFAGDIYRESKRLIALLEDIINLSRLDESDHEEPVAPVNLLDMSRDVLDSLRAAAEPGNIKLTASGDSVEVTGVEHILWEMIYNLCDNAIKYNRPGGSVEVRVARRPGETRLTVSDTGIGIPYADQKRVFERFYRVDKSHSKEIGGTGLGLSIVKHGAQYHNASVELESVPDKGTAITLVFPD